MELEELYQEVILDHFKNPRCQFPIIQPTSSFLAINPLCGDKVNLSVKIEDGLIKQLHFAGHGCCISQAATSIMSELCEGKSIAEAKELISQYRRMMKGEVEGAACPGLEEARTLEGVKKFTARLKCALIGWEALDKCIEQFLAIKDPENS